MTGILNVDLLAFEQGGSIGRAATVDGVMQSLRTGFVYTKHDISEGLLDEAYEVLEKFFALPTEAKEDYFAQGSKGQSGYTGLLVETAAVSDTPDWKEMFNWGAALPSGHPLRDRYPHRYGEPIFPSDRIPGADRILSAFHEHLVQLQTRFLRIIAVGIGAHEHFFDTMLKHGSHLTRAIRYPPMSEAPNAGQEGHVWAEEHGDINLITALPRATARGLQVEVDVSREPGCLDDASQLRLSPDAAGAPRTQCARERLRGRSQLLVGFVRPSQLLGESAELVVPVPFQLIDLALHGLQSLVHRRKGAENRLLSALAIVARREVGSRLGRQLPIQQLLVIELRLHPVLVIEK